MYSVGDKLRVIDDSDGFGDTFPYDEGDVVTVTEVYKDTDVKVTSSVYRNSDLLWNINRFQPMINDGDTVELIEDYGEDFKKGDILTVQATTSLKLPESIVHSYRDSDNKFCACFYKRLKKVDSGMNSKRPKVLHHCMKVVEGTNCFDKLGDFTESPDDIEQYLAETYGEGIYIIKMKNENSGYQFKVGRPITPKYEITQHRFS